MLKHDSPFSRSTDGEQLITFDVLAGVALSGKTTIIQQLRRLYAGGFDYAERKDLRENIWLYTLAEMQLAFKKKEEKAMKFVNEDSEVTTSPKYVSTGRRTGR